MDAYESGPIVVAVPDQDVYPSLRYGSWEALIHGASLELIHVLRPDEDPTEARAIMQEAVELAELLAGPGVPVTGKSVVGAPVAAALAAVAGARLVVVRERDTVHLLRTIAERQPDHPLPAIVCVPTDWELRPDDRRPVLVGVDDPDRCRSLVARALHIAHVHGATLRVVHAWHFPPPYDDLVERRVGEHWRRESQARIRATVSHCVGQSGYHEVPVDVSVQHGVPATLLVDAARDAQLLVLKTNAPRAKVGARLGRTARAALHECPCPVLLLPPGDMRPVRPATGVGARTSRSARVG